MKAIFRGLPGPALAATNMSGLRPFQSARFGRDGGFHPVGVRNRLRFAVVCRRATMGRGQSKAALKRTHSRRWRNHVAAPFRAKMAKNRGLTVNRLER